MKRNATNTYEQPIKKPENVNVAEKGADVPSDVRIDPFARYTNDPPENWRSMYPDETNKSSMRDSIASLFTDDPDEGFTFGAYCDFENAIDALVQRLITYSNFAMNIPDCEFHTEIDPEVWLDKKSFNEIRTVARLLYTVFEQEYKAISGYCMLYRYSIEKYFPTAHRDEATSMLWEYNEKLHNPEYGEARLSKDNMYSVEKMNVYLMEAAYYYIWKIKISLGFTPSNDDLFKGFKTVDKREKAEFWF